MKNIDMALPVSAMNVIEAINARRSVRGYTGKEVDAITIYTLLEAAVRAPTAMHEEPWGFVIVQDPKLLHVVSEKAKKVFVEKAHQLYPIHSKRITETFSSPEFDIFYGASTLIIICAAEGGGFVTADCWLAAENLMLAACSMGLGTCVIGAAVDTLNMRDVKTLLDIPADHVAVAPIIVGYPSAKTAQTSRKKPGVLAWLTDKAELG